MMKVGNLVEFPFKVINGLESISDVYAWDKRQQYRGLDSRKYVSCESKLSKNLCHIRPVDLGQIPSLHQLIAADRAFERLR